MYKQLRGENKLQLVVSAPCATCFWCHCVICRLPHKKVNYEPNNSYFAYSTDYKVTNLTHAYNARAVSKTSRYFKTMVLLIKVTQNAYLPVQKAHELLKICRLITCTLELYICFMFAGKLFTNKNAPVFPAIHLSVLVKPTLKGLDV